MEKVSPHFGESDFSELKRSIPAGTCDIFGYEARQREAVIDTIKGVYELHGFEPLHTPILEHSIVFNGHHGEGEKLLFCLGDCKNNPLVLRYDLTVPLARVISMYPHLPRPFKRYQIASVFRDDNVDKGHFREFTQCDGDVVGAKSLTADADILSLAHHGLSKLGFNDFSIRVNHRSIIKGIALAAGVESREGVLEVQRALDFADKIIKNGLEGVETDLRKRNLPEAVIQSIMAVLDVSGSAQDVLRGLRPVFGSRSIAAKGLDELEEILSYLPSYMLNDVKVDLTLARGADYYTGFILEGVIPGVPVGAVLGGGRYDNLVAAFHAPEEPAVGMAFGLERILTSMRELGMDGAKHPEKVLVASERHVCPSEAVKLARQLRSRGIETDLCCEHQDGDSVTDYARNRGFKVLVIYKPATNEWLVEDLHQNGSSLFSTVQKIIQS